MAVHGRYNSWYNSLLSLQNSNVKWPNFALYGEREPQRLIFYLFFISNLSMSLRFSFLITLTVINKVNDIRVPRDS